MALFQCKHDTCGHKDSRGFGFYCNTFLGLEKHQQVVKYHPCCQDGKVCAVGSKIKVWRKAVVFHSFRVQNTCPHPGCALSFSQISRLEKHLKKYRKHKCDPDECDLCKGEIHETDARLHDDSTVSTMKNRHSDLHTIQDDINESRDDNEEDEVIADVLEEIEASLHEGDAIEGFNEVPDLLDVDMPDGHELVLNPVKEPTKCPTGCGFFGTVETDGYCLFCFNKRIRFTNESEETEENPAKKAKLT